MKKSKYFKYYQPNKKDLKDEQGDCVIRALTKAFNKEWATVFTELVPYALEFQAMPNNKLCYEKYILENGGKWESIKVERGKKRPTVNTFTRSHKQGTYILRLAHHIVTVEDGFFYDTWDSGEKSLYGYWRIR